MLRQIVVELWKFLDLACDEGDPDALAIPSSGLIRKVLRERDVELAGRSGLQRLDRDLDIGRRVALTKKELVLFALVRRFSLQLLDQHGDQVAILWLTPLHRLPRPVLLLDPGEHLVDVLVPHLGHRALDGEPT